MAAENQGEPAGVQGQTIAAMGEETACGVGGTDDGGESVTEREKREKGINGLKCHVINMNCLGCPYDRHNGDPNCIDDLMADVYDMLKAHEPRVMTHGEVINLPEGAVAWFEEMDNGSRRYIQPMMSNGKAFMIGTHVDVNVSRGTLNWTNRRFWTSRPTYELMEATPWNDTHNLGIGKK